MKIAVLGLGSLALADALALARRYRVEMTGPMRERVAAISAGRFPVEDPALDSYLARHRLDLGATTDPAAALDGAGLVLVSVPVPMDAAGALPRVGRIEAAVACAVRHCPGVPVVIRSAVPVGFCERMRARHPGAAILPAPEFLRAGTPLTDVLRPSVLIVGDRGETGARVGAILADAALEPGAPLRQMGATEAEAVRHLSQVMLAARVTYFNELDSYALTHGLDAGRIIRGVSLDPRVGDHANNPCFGYGGTGLARSQGTVDALFAGLPAAVMVMTGRASEARLGVLQAEVLRRAPRRVGIARSRTTAGAPAGGGAGDLLTRLGMRLTAAGVDVREGPDSDLGWGAGCDLVLAQRRTPALDALDKRLFSRDLFPRTGARAGTGA